MPVETKPGRSLEGLIPAFLRLFAVCGRRREGRLDLFEEHQVGAEDLPQDPGEQYADDQEEEEQEQEERGKVRGSESHNGNSDLLGEREFSRFEGRRRNL